MGDGDGCEQRDRLKHATKKKAVGRFKRTRHATTKAVQQPTVGHA
jgi:hypothetical protein